MDSENLILKENKTENFSIVTSTMTISPYILKKLDRHVSIIRNLIDRGTSKRTWINQAIREKLVSDLEKQLLPKNPVIALKIEKNLDEALAKRLEYTKKFRSSYSKKHFIVEAILEKLDKEENLVKEKMLEACQINGPENDFISS